MVANMGSARAWVRIVVVIVLAWLCCQLFPLCLARAFCHNMRVTWPSCRCLLVASALPLLFAFPCSWADCLAVLLPQHGGSFLPAQMSLECMRRGLPPSFVQGQAAAVEARRHREALLCRFLTSSALTSLPPLSSPPHRRIIAAGAR